MNLMQILNIILTVFILLVGGYSAYNKTGKTIYSKISYLISEAESLNIIGPAKMERVVNALYGYVPDVFRKALTKPKLQAIAQKIYDDMKLFAERNK